MFNSIKRKSNQNGAACSCQDGSSATSWGLRHRGNTWVQDRPCPGSFGPGRKCWHPCPVRDLLEGKQRPSSPFPFLADWELTPRKQSDLPKDKPPAAGPRPDDGTCSPATWAWPAWSGGGWRWADGPGWSPTSPSPSQSCSPHKAQLCRVLSTQLRRAFATTTNTESHFLTPLTSRRRRLLPAGHFNMGLTIGQKWGHGHERS